MIDKKDLARQIAQRGRKLGVHPAEMRAIQKDAARLADERNDAELNAELRRLGVQDRP